MLSQQDDENDHPNTPTSAQYSNKKKVIRTKTSSSGNTSVQTSQPSPSSKATSTMSSAAQSTSSSTSPSSTSSSVQVAVRVRPSLPSENGSHKCISIRSTKPSTGGGRHNHGHNRNISNMIEIGAGGSKMGGNSKQFLFDACFSPKASQREVFHHSVRPLVDACLDGYNATVLAVSRSVFCILWLTIVNLYDFSSLFFVW